MTDTLVQKFAKVLVEHSTRIKAGDRVLIEGTTAAEPLIRELFIQILEKGGHPHPLVALPGMMPFSQDEMYVTYAKDTQLDFVPTFYKLAYDQFSRASASIPRRIHAGPAVWIRSKSSDAARL